MVLSVAQRADGVKMTPYERRCDVLTSRQRYYGVFGTIRPQGVNIDEAQQL